MDRHAIYLDIPFENTDDAKTIYGCQFNTSNRSWFIWSDKLTANEAVSRWGELNMPQVNRGIYKYEAIMHPPLVPTRLSSIDYYRLYRHYKQRRGKYPTCSHCQNPAYISSPVVKISKYLYEQYTFDDDLKIKKLTNLELVCEHCLRHVHIRSIIKPPPNSYYGKNVYPDAKKHIMELNKWTEPEFNKYIIDQMNLYKMRSDYTLDLSILSDAGLTIVDTHADMRDFVFT